MDGMMEKATTEPAELSERPQRAGGDKSAAGPPPQRFSAKRKLRAVSRLLRGEPLELLARELNVTAARLSQWRDRALLAAAATPKEHERDDRDDEITRLKGKVGEMTMETELLREKIARLEAGAPLARRRSEAMRQAVSPSADRVYGLARVARCGDVSRATVYRHRQAPVVPKRRPGPVGPCDDATLLQHIKKAIAASRARAIAKSGPVCASPASAARPAGCDA